MRNSTRAIIQKHLFSVFLAPVFFYIGILQANSSTLYTYDNTGRVISALYDNSVCMVYQYDANGNRTSEIVTNAGTGNTPQWGVGNYGCFRWSQ